MIDINAEMQLKMIELDFKRSFSKVDPQSSTCRDPLVILLYDQSISPFHWQDPKFFQEHLGSI